MIGRIRERRDFERLTRHGRRARTATLWCRFVDDIDVRPPRVAFAVGRAVGGAVERNRLRRRLRAILRAASAAAPPTLHHGLLLVGATSGAGERSFGELEREVSLLLRVVTPTAAEAVEP